MMEFTSFDIEIYNDLVDGENIDLSEILPSVSAFCTKMDGSDLKYHEGLPYMSQETAKKLVYELIEKQDAGYTIFTWNGLGFDIKLLAYYSGLFEECGKLALDSVDGMFLVVSQKGYMLGLDKALVGAKLETKLHRVTLNDGSTLSDMNGSKAPLLWRSGEYNAVKEYLKYDVIQPLKLAYHIQSTGRIVWTSNSERLNSFKTNMLTVRECLSIQEPDVSWMTNPVQRKSFYDWIPERLL